MAVEAIVLGTADWDQPIPTNQHYVAQALADRMTVTFVESMGLRRPQLTYRDLRRMSRRLVPRPNGLVQRRERPRDLLVVSPRVIPWHHAPATWVNNPAVGHIAKAWRRSRLRKLLWTFTPLTYGLEEAADAAVYHCVDLLGAFPGVDRAAITRGERRLARQGVPAIASSVPVLRHLQENGFERVIYWPNVADTDVIEGQRQFGSRRQPRAVFAGNITGKKLDFHLLERLVDAGIPLTLIGPVNEGGGREQGQLRRLVAAGATYDPGGDLAYVARQYQAATVGLIPYTINAYTHGVNPLKTYEYLAAGAAVVATPIPSVEPMSGDVFVEHTAAAFLSSVVEALDLPTADAVTRRLAIARAHSWTQRRDEIGDLVSDLLP